MTVVTVPEDMVPALIAEAAALRSQLAEASAEIERLRSRVSGQWCEDKPLHRITIILDRRSDGGLRVQSEEVPGLILSGPDPYKILRDIPTALEVLGALK